jgi:hypothetical protein
MSFLGIGPGELTGLAEDHGIGLKGSLKPPKENGSALKMDWIP